MSERNSPNLVDRFGSKSVDFCQSPKQGLRHFFTNLNLHLSAFNTCQVLQMLDRLNP